MGSASARPEQAASKGQPEKLSFKQKFALESLPKKIEAVTASIARLENNIADPSFYERDPASFQKTIAALDKERVTLAALEEEWLELEMLREEMEGSLARCGSEQSARLRPTQFVGQHTARRAGARNRVGRSAPDLNAGPASGAPRNKRLLVLKIILQHMALKELIFKILH